MKARANTLKQKSRLNAKKMEKQPRFTNKQNLFLVFSKKRLHFFIFSNTNITFARETHKNVCF
jgi:hypothetical protein